MTIVIPPHIAPVLAGTVRYSQDQELPGMSVERSPDLRTNLDARVALSTELAGEMVAELENHAGLVDTFLDTSVQPSCQRAHCSFSNFPKNFRYARSNC